MDWTMIDNADSSTGRITTLYYLLTCRYDVSAEYAGQKLKKEPKSNLLWGKLLLELEQEITEPENNLGMGTVFTDSKSRIYLKDMLSAYYDA
jgi:hypothetical protein